MSVLERALSKRLNRARRQNPAVLNPQVDWLCEVKSRIVAESPRWLSRDESVGSPYFPRNTGSRRATALEPDTG